MVPVISEPLNTTDITSIDGTRKERCGVVSVVSHPEGDTTIPPLERGKPDEKPVVSSCYVHGKDAIFYVGLGGNRRALFATRR